MHYIATHKYDAENYHQEASFGIVCIIPAKSNIIPSHTHIGLNRSDTLDLINLTLTMHIKLLCMYHLYSTFSGLYDCTMCTDHRHD